ncbi:MAG: hypothetical protein IPJ49_20840 [Candidatus Obscuribacter sp.]|jgi:hypothetical protein|nr:hypothetical protein [Candidatus Obscuribacter sp.]
MKTTTKSQLLKEVFHWFIEGILMYLVIAAFVALFMISIHWAYGGINFGDAPVLGFFKSWGLMTLAFMAVFIAFRIFLFCVELVLFLVFAIGYIGYKWWQERRKDRGPGGPPSLRDRNPGEPPHR